MLDYKGDKRDETVERLPMIGVEHSMWNIFETNKFMLLEEIDICLLELDEVNYCIGELELHLDL